jgi:hypothetical protein
MDRGRLRQFNNKDTEGIWGGFVSAKQNFSTLTTVVIDHEITTRRADAAEPSQCRQTRRG